MVTAISSAEADEVCRESPFPLSDYYAWRDEDETPRDRFPAVASSTARLRPRSRWNSLGRETYHRAAVDRHANLSAGILGAVGATTFLVRQAVHDAKWFDSDLGAAKAKADRFGRALRPGGESIDFASWRGAFVFRSDTPLMLATFLDYPFRLRTYDVEILSLDRPILLNVSHHLAIVYLSDQSTCLDAIRQAVLATGILEYPNRV